MSFRVCAKTFYLAMRRLLLAPFMILRKVRIPEEGEVKNILILRHDRIGDMVLSTPVFAALKRKYPDAAITVLASDRNKDVILNDPNVDEILPYKGIVWFIKEFRRRKTDLAIDLFYTYEMNKALLTFISGARFRLGFEQAGRGIFFNINGPEISPTLDMVSQFARLMKSLRVDTGDFTPELHILEEETDWAASYLKSKGLMPDDLKIAFSPGGYYPAQRWGAENFALLAKRVAGYTGAKIIFFGEKREEAMIRKATENAGCKDMTVSCDLTIRQFIAALGRCGLLVCNNSGPLHIASSLSVPTVSIIGPEDPVLWNPVGRDNIAIRRPLPCSPCSRAFCARHDCMRLITVEEVLKAVEAQIERIKNAKEGSLKKSVSCGLERPKRVLVINLGGVGDVLLSAPALKALRALYPDAVISMLSSARALEVMKGLPCIDGRLVFHIRYGGEIPLHSIFENLKTLFALRKEKFDLAINMRTIGSGASAWKMKFLLNIIKPRLKAGRDTEGRGYFFDVKIPESDLGEKSEMEYNMDLVKALGAHPVDDKIDFVIDKKAQDKVNEILEREGVREGDIVIGLHPGGMPSRRWPARKFSGLIRNINDKIPCRFVVTGGADESSLADEIAASSGDAVINTAGRLDIAELGALIGRCNLFISNDTAPMHIAAILKVPLVAIFGGGDLKRFDPRNISDKAVIFRAEAACAPCNKVVCKSMKCLEDISPEEVAKEALRILADPRTVIDLRGRITQTRSTS